MAPPARAADGVTVFAAASLKNALDTVAEAWQAATSKVARISYAGTPALAKQIEQGAPADIFFSADLDWMDYLAQKNLIDTESQTRLLGNAIVLIAPKDSAATTRIATGFPLSELLAGGRLAMADVEAVPAGRYGKAALQRLQVWSSVENSIAQAENVRAALKLVATGEAPLGIVYGTDALAEPSVKVIATFPPESHPPIIFSVARIAASENPDAAAFLAFLKSPAATEIFRAHGFTVPAGP